MSSSSSAPYSSVGRKIGDNEAVNVSAVPSGMTEDTSVIGEYGSAHAVKIPGTIALVSVFFISFVLYYFVNWKYLSEIWPLR